MPPASERLAAPQGWLLDTNVVSELRRGARSNRAVLAWAQSVPPVACFLSEVTVTEIVMGIEPVDDVGFRTELEAWLRDGVRAWFGSRILPVDAAMLLAWRRLIRDGAKTRYTYSQPNAMIAATALVHKLVVVTRNVEDFGIAGVAVLNPWSDI